MYSATPPGTPPLAADARTLTDADDVITLEEGVQMEPEPEPQQAMQEYARTRHSKKKDAKQQIPQLPMEARQYDFFVNHCHKSGQDQCRTLATELKSRVRTQATIPTTT